MAKTKNETRQTIERDSVNPEPHLDSGYEGDDTSDEFSIPPCGIEDADVALFNLFDKDVGFTDHIILSNDEEVSMSKPFVVFAIGERFAHVKPPRDLKNKRIMLPAISIRRTSLTQTPDDITGRGINQFTGVLEIKRRLAADDRDYQNLINKLALPNLSLPTTRRKTGEAALDIDIHNGGLLASKFGDNIWETITIPQPQFFTATYEVVFWTNYTQSMNYLIETYISSFLPQARAHKLGTDKGYWFMAYTEDIFTSQDNFDDITQDERVVRYTFNVVVKGYILAPNHETNMVPVRRWISAPPKVTFESIPENSIPRSTIDRQDSLENQDKFILSDIEQDPEKRQEPTTLDKYVVEKQVLDPKTGKLVTKTVSIRQRNQKKGETVFYAENEELLQEFFDSLNK